MNNNSKSVVGTKPMYKRDLVREHGAKVYRARGRHPARPGVIVFRSVIYRVLPDGSVRRLRPEDEQVIREREQVGVDHAT